jgi:glyoxylase-like metal-dependent hydrolase (beta-lactamase superfamily II)
VLIQVDGGWLLLDTGYNPVLVRDPQLRRRFHDRFEGIVPVLPPGDDPLVDALDTAGLVVDEISAVAVSHLHRDHAGGLRHFAGRVPVHLQRDELTFGLSSGAEAHGVIRVDFDDPTIEWDLADDDVDIAPGVTAVRTAGHTPGHQSFVVRYDRSLGGGGFVFAFDAADLAENIQRDLPIGGVVGCNPEDTVEPIRRLKAIASAERLRLVPGHDPDVWPRLTKDLHAVGGVPQDA